MLRPATLDDLPQLHSLAVSMVAESNFMPFGVKLERFNKFMSAMITHGFVVVSQKEGELVGAMIGDVMTPWYSDYLMGIEHAIYIKPEHQSGIVAARMIKQWVQWCKGKGAIQCRAFVGTGNPAVCRLFVAMGFRQEHASYIFDLQE